MPFFELTSEERMRLQRLNLDKSAVFALKKLFLNVCTSEPSSNEAIQKITRAFYELSVIRPDDKQKISEGNLV